MKVAGGGTSRTSSPCTSSVGALQDKWRNIQKCEKRKSRPSREDRQPCLSSTTSIPAGSARCRRLCGDLHGQQCAVQSPMPACPVNVLSTADHKGTGSRLLLV